MFKPFIVHAVLRSAGLLTDAAESIADQAARLLTPATAPSPRLGRGAAVRFGRRRRT